jgi:hypothetical protein
MAIAGLTNRSMDEVMIARGHAPANVAPPVRRYGGGAAKSIDSGGATLGWQDVWYGFGAALHAIVDPVVDLAAAQFKIYTDFENSYIGNSAKFLVNDIRAWGSGGFKSTSTYNFVSDTASNRYNYLAENPLRLIPQFAQGETAMQMGVAGYSWWGNASLDQKVDAVGQGIGIAATFYTPEAWVSVANVAAKGEALYDAYRKT